MEHKLCVLVRLDIDSSNTVLETSGCLTECSCQALYPIIRRAASLVDGLGVTVDLSPSAHIDPRGLDLLEQFGAGQLVDSTSPDGEGFHGTLKVIAPPVLPECPSLKAGWEHKAANAA